jgi:hypothetical protein
MHGTMHRSRPTRRLAPLGAAACLLLFACVSPEMRGSSDRGRIAATSATPAWVGAPLDWNKLEEVERWLRGPDAAVNERWRVEGELTLAEGRVEFAREALAEDGDDQLVLARLGAARAGYQRVLDDPGADSMQRTRARAGLAGLSELASRVGEAPAPALAAGELVPRARWRARAAVPSNMTPTRGGYDRITVHHTAEVPGSRFDGSLDDSLRVVNTVQRNHMGNEGWGDIGYHFLIDAAGRIYEGRSLRYQGAHAGGDANRNNIGICMIGNFQHGSPSQRAMASLEATLAELRREHSIRRDRVHGHREFKSTECPGPALARWVEDYGRRGPRLAELGGSSGGAPAVRTASVAPATGRAVSAAPASRSLRGPARSATVR